MHIHRLVLVFIAVLVSAAAARVTAQRAAPAATSASTAPTLNDTSLLWRISDPQAERPSYLFGTIHMIPSDDYFLEPTVVRAINETDEILFEIDPREMQNPAVMMSLMGKINMRGDTSLEDLLPAARYDSIASYFSATGLPMFMLNRMKPMFLSAMVGQDMSGGGPFGGGGSNGMQSYEFELTKIAEAADRPISGLETMDFQLSLFDSIPYTVQADMLYKAVAADMGEDLGTGETDLEKMVAMYKRRAVAEMSQLITDESAGYGNFEELLVVRRNAQWVPTIMERLSATPSVYAVGAGHLGGSSGVIALLRANGITVEPVY
ncbi:TraB/GumN family protein [Lewinella sp. JB7]|uniref:TraB/GumN family protein n=1 Tax=Lewinella sp. JB7 TaxID=2962887 RepID=UPI0020C9A2AA|nr:TraB/GumN family protein [Lewinella sp. JB7]MCP9235755.1 TraB/GumN family protein [Lewinella sp. JB7]